MRETINHFVEETSTFDLDWSESLGDGETISSSTWRAEPVGRLTVTGRHTEAVSHATVSGGIARWQHVLVNQIVTSSARTLSAEYFLNTRKRAAPDASAKPPKLSKQPAA